MIVFRHDGAQSSELVAHAATYLSLNRLAADRQLDELAPAIVSMQLTGMM